MRQIAHGLKGNHVLESAWETVSAQRAWLGGEVNQPPLHNCISQLRAIRPSWHGQPNQPDTAGGSLPSGVGGNSSSSASASGLLWKCLENSRT